MHAVERLLVVPAVALFAGGIELQSHIAPVLRLELRVRIGRDVGVALNAGIAARAVHGGGPERRVNRQIERLPIRQRLDLVRLAVTPQTIVVADSCRERRGGRCRARTRTGEHQRGRNQRQAQAKEPGEYRPTAASSHDSAPVTRSPPLAEAVRLRLNGTSPYGADNTHYPLG